MEHMEIEDKIPIHRLYRDHINSGLAFGAERWLSTLQRTCERFARLMLSSTSTSDGGGNSCMLSLTFNAIFLFSYEKDLYSE